MIMPTNIA